MDSHRHIRRCAWRDFPSSSPRTCVREIQSANRIWRGLRLRIRLSIDVWARGYLTLAMRLLIFLFLCGALLTGCKTKSAKAKNQAAGEPQTAPRLTETVTPL